MEPAAIVEVEVEAVRTREEPLAFRRVGQLAVEEARAARARVALQAW